MNQYPPHEKELKKCSGCCCTMLLTEKYYKINRKGEFAKTCLSCAEYRVRLKNKKKDQLKKEDPFIQFNENNELKNKN